MIKTENLNFLYPSAEDANDNQNALTNLNITVKKGEFVAILGHNGSGKSTLAKHINALLTPTSGAIYVNELDTSDSKNIWPIRQSIGMLFQNPDNQIVASIVEEDVAFGPENLGVPPQEIRQRVDDALATVGMTEHAESPPHNLSGGQKQRVAIAGVLAMKPDCIVLDEPTAMLDPQGRKEVIGTALHLNQEYGVTVILITHFMEEAALAQRVIVMHGGQVAMDDTPHNVFSQVTKMESLGIGVPQITALAHKLQPSANLPITVDEFVQQINIPQPQQPPSRYAPLQTTAPILALKDVSHTYSPGTPFEKKAIDGINIDIHLGEIMAIIGHTGSGKSTLIQHLNGLLTPTEGYVEFSGKTITKDDLVNLRQQVGLVFQYPEHQLFESTVSKDIAFGPKQLGLSEEETNDRVRQALATVGLPEALMEKSPFELSGGQKRRVAIAGVLAMHPQVLVLDEPTAGLDPQGKRELQQQILTMHKELGIAVVLISHSMEDVAALAHKIVVLNHGHIAHHGMSQEIFSKNRELMDIGLDTPELTKLFARLHEINPSIPKGVFSLADAMHVLNCDCLEGEA